MFQAKLQNSRSPNGTISAISAIYLLLSPPSLEHVGAKKNSAIITYVIS